MANDSGFFLSKRIFKDLDRIKKEDLSMIRDAVYKLRDDPFPEGAKKLKGKKNLILRIKVKKYRIIYMVEVMEKRTVVLAVGQRKDVYRIKIKED